MISKEDKAWLMSALVKVNSDPKTANEFRSSRENINKIIQLQQQVGREELNKVIDQLRGVLKP